ncbi:MAG: uroporphyrinogen-III C-methyltransferase [Pseudomonas sp.]
MSEADSNKDPLQTPASEPVPAAEPAKPVSSRPASSGAAKAVASLALLVGLGGVALGGYSFWQLQQFGAQEADRQVSLQKADEQAQQLAAGNQQLAARLGRLEQLPSVAELDERRRLLATLQSDQQRLAGRVEQVLGASREEWRLAEAEHLLRMAMLQLSAMQDVKSAEMLVAEADLILQNQDDPSAYAARQKLLEGLEALRSLPQLDRTGLFLQLGALRGQSSRLSALAPEFVNGEAGTEEPGQSRWQHWLNELTRFVRVDFDAGANVKPLLAGQTLGQVRLALSLAIEQAQWAVLNGNAEVYQQALRQASELISDHFSEDNGQARGLRERIDALAQREVEVQLPDLSSALKALQAYVEKREAPTESDTPEQEAQRT